MKVANKFSILKVLFVVMVVALSSTFFFNYKIYEDAKKTKLILTGQKNELLQDLVKSKDSLEIAILENSSLRTELIVERQKVANLLREISSSNVDFESIFKYKKEVDNLKQSIESLTKERNELNQNNELLKVQRDSTILVLTNAKKHGDQLKEINSDLNRTIRKGSAITIVNLKSSTYKQNSKGELELTDRARKVNLLQISFMVVGSKISKPSNKEYYVQIIDCKNNIIGDRKTKKFGSMVLDYSYVTLVKFKNESIEVSADLIMENAEKGTYWVNVFDKGGLASRTTFKLR